MKLVSNATIDLIIADGATIDTAIDSIATAITSVAAHAATAKAEVQAAAGPSMPNQRESGMETLGNATSAQNLQRAIAASFERAGIGWVLGEKRVRTASGASGSAQDYFSKRLQR